MIDLIIFKLKSLFHKCCFCKKRMLMGDCQFTDVNNDLFDKEGDWFHFECYMRQYP